MKLKKLMAKMMCVSIVMSNFVMASASNVIINETTINDINTTSNYDNIENEWTTDESNVTEIEVSYAQASRYSVTIPKTITLDSRKQATYSVKVTGDIDTNQRVYVSPVDGISDTEKIDFYMKDQNSKKSDVVATVTQNKLYWSSDEVTNGYEETNNSISATDLTSGTWKGTFQVEIKLQTFNNTVDEDNKQQVAGLYDADGVLLANWEESGIDETCSNAKDIINNTYPSTTKVVIPDSVISIYNATSYSNSAFCECTLLKEVVIPDTVTDIGDYAFYGCTSLETVNIPDLVSRIGNKAFRECTSLKSIEIPDSIQSIGEDAFWECTSLTNVELPDSVVEISGGIFYGCSSLKNIVISNSATNIGQYAFFGCSSLTEIIIPDLVTNIGNGAFSGCASLKNIGLPSGVTSINNYLFQGCKSLTSIEIPDSVTYMGDSVFYDCTSLTEINIPDSVNSIGIAVFYNCTSLDVEIPNTVKTIKTNAFYQVPHITYHGTASGSPWGAKSIN